MDIPLPLLEEPGLIIHKFKTPSISICAGQTFFSRSKVLRAFNIYDLTALDSVSYLNQKLLASLAALVEFLHLGSPLEKLWSSTRHYHDLTHLDDRVVLCQELLPLVLPQLGRRNVQVRVVSTPEKLIASGSELKISIDLHS